VFAFQTKRPEFKIQDHKKKKKKSERIKVLKDKDRLRNCHRDQGGMKTKLILTGHWKREY
jgi:hypothetical protein